LYQGLVVTLPIPVGKLKEGGRFSSQDFLDCLQVGVIPALQVGKQIFDRPETEKSFLNSVESPS
jgi:hypothetical protein